MNWMQGLSKALCFMEEHMTDELSIDEIASQAFSSSSHFQLVFHVVMGMTLGEYIRNRRLSLAAQDLLVPGDRIIDVAMRYRYDTQESFTKAFQRFHGVTPAKARQWNVSVFLPLSIDISIKGGFVMNKKLIDEFYWRDENTTEEKGTELTDAEKYNRIVNWASKARGRNPNVFDTLTGWILDDAEWTPDKLAENEQILMQGVFARFKEQNAQLRKHLMALTSSGVVNTVVFEALDRFDDELSGKTHDKHTREAVARMFADFSTMRSRDIRMLIAGEKTGPTGVDNVEIYGYINVLKDCDAEIQWALFMPDAVKRQQQGFKMDSMEYVRMPAMRFIGREGEEYADVEVRKQLFRTLDAMSEYASGFDYDLFFEHHYGKNVDVGPWHGVWGRFMKADAPVPEGFLHFDFIPQRKDGPIQMERGTPYIAQFAFATFSGDMEAMHRHEGFDVHAMYDVTRNIMLGQSVRIPYPDKYWTAGVFLDGCDKPSTAYLFSAEL